MTNFIRKHRMLTILLTVLLVVILITIFAGRSISNFAIEQVNQMRSKDKIVCTIKAENATQIVYEGKTYQVLNETVDGSKIGGWTGVFRKIVILDDHYRVINQVKSDVDCTSQVKELAKHLPQGAKYVVTFFNVFTIKGINDKEAIAVNLDSGTYKAVLAGNKLADKNPIQFKKEG